MIITIKPHSVYKNLFTSLELRADFNTYYDILFYLNAMQNKFIQYVSRQKENNIEESFTFLDKNLREINSSELQIRKVKEGDILHIVPAIIGGGGKRGGLFAILAFAAFFVAAPMLLGGAAATGAAAGAAGGVASSISIGGGISGMLAGMSPFMSNLVTNIGLALLSMLFASPLKKAEATRENDAFGSLTNSTNSGTPVALHYGLVRVAGQLISGYVSTISHGRNEEVNVYGNALEVSR